MLYITYKIQLKEIHIYINVQMNPFKIRTLFTTMSRGLYIGN